MELTELFGPEDLVVGFEPADKWQAIRDLVDHLVGAGRLEAGLGEEVYEAVLSREKSMSTGMERGVAIPHAAVDNLPEVVASMGLVSKEDGLAFDSIDGQPARVVVLLLIPRAQKLLHIRTLADVARTLSRDGVRAALLEAADPAAAYALLEEQET